MRINAYLARAGITSRRGADELIKAGKVLINNRPAKLNDDVAPNDEVSVDGKRVVNQKLRYILLNKPAGTLTTLSDPQNRPKIVDLIKIPERVVPVGRLDYDTSGVLLLTNDGELAHRLMHPSFEIDKVYLVTVAGTITPQILTKLSSGVKLEDGLTAPATAKQISENKIELTIHEGKKNQVKRMVAAVGLNFVSLERTKYGALDSDNLEEGQWLDLTKSEIQSLMSSVKMVQ